MASSGRSSLPFARRYTLQTLQRFNILLACLIPQPTGTPRPHQWLMGAQACRLPALKRLKPLKPLKPLKLCRRASERSTAQAKAIPRQHQRLLLDGPACRSPGVTRFKPFNALTFSWHALFRRQQAPQGHINGLWAPKPAVCQPLNA